MSQLRKLPKPRTSQFFIVAETDLLTICLGKEHSLCYMTSNKPVICFEERHHLCPPIQSMLEKSQSTRPWIQSPVLKGEKRSRIKAVSSSSHKTCRNLIDVENEFLVISSLISSVHRAFYRI